MRFQDYDRPCKHGITETGMKGLFICRLSKKGMIFSGLQLPGM